jgi:hypothetical protein
MMMNDDKINLVLDTIYFLYFIFFFSQILKYKEILRIFIYKIHYTYYNKNVFYKKK